MRAVDCTYTAAAYLLAGDLHFPNDDSVLRLIGALPAEHNETWQERKHPDMEEFREWAEASPATTENNNVVALTG